MKKSKKFVLAGLVLPFTGCETEVDTDSPRQEQPATERPYPTEMK